jgi:hypothetical protein
MTDKHPITPPPELVHQWHKEACLDPYHGGTFFESKTLKHVATQAAQWGADQELEACCEWLEAYDYDEVGRQLAELLRAARRPKPPTLAEQAKAELDDAVMRGDCITTTDAMPYLRRAIQRLAELEKQITH